MSHPQSSVETESPDPQATRSHKCQAKPAQIVDWVPETGLNAPRKTAPRLYHKKSRTGCQHCRTRRVKCDEVHPVCGSCLRHHAACVWDRTDVSGKSQTYEIRTKASSNPEASSLKQEKIVLPESKDRRLLELQLLHHYTADTASTVNVQTDPNRHIWAKTVPRVAFTNSALLYSIYTLAALHLANLDRENVDHVLTYQRYLGLTLQEHRKDVANLGHNNADAAVLTATLLRLCNFALLQERSCNPYTPPTQWLHMSSTVGRGLSIAAWKYIHNDENSVMRSLIQAAPGVTTNGNLRDDDILFQESNRRKLLYLLRRTQANIETEPWDPDIQEAYETTLSYIGSIHLAIVADELPESVFRRIVLFPMMVKLSFVALVEERQPRALVILAHYFSFLMGFSHFWWIGDTGPKEVRGIKSVLPEEWLDLMDAPLKAITDQTGNF